MKKRKTVHKKFVSHPWFYLWVALHIHTPTHEWGPDDCFTQSMPDWMDDIKSHALWIIYFDVMYLYISPSQRL